MATYVHEGRWNLYVSGIYEGYLEFGEDTLRFARIEPRQRTQLQPNTFHEASRYHLPLGRICEAAADFAGADWTGDEVRLRNGDVYQRHVQYRAVLDGVEEVSQVFARRNDTAVDVVTVGGRIVAFVCPHRYGMEVLVRPGWERLTPLVVYEDPRLSQPLYGQNDLGTFLVPMRDGVRLATDVILPEGIEPGARVPTILVRTCYDRNGKKHAWSRYANRGYAVVCQDVRGRADSEGDLVPFFYEREDSADTLDWIVAQPWCDGNVGMWGASYLGYVVVAAATSGHPNLKAVVDEVNVGSPFVDTVRRGGTVCSWPLLCWTLAQSVGNRTDFDVFAGRTVNPEQVVDTRPIREIPQKTIGKASGPWDLWAEHPDYDDFWCQCTFSERGDQVRVPMFVISGWYDGDSAGVSEAWRMLTEHDVPNRKIWLGPWEHNPNRARDLGGQHFGNDAVVYDYDVQVLRWFDRFLKGMANGIDKEPRATYYVVGENRWHTSSDWTPTEATVTPFYLCSGGRANSRNGDGALVPPEALPWLAEAERIAGQCGVEGAFEFEPAEGNSPSSAPTECRAESDTYLYDPRHPFTDSGEREPEVLDHHELRSDILVYTSPPLGRPLLVAGELSAVVYAASSAVDTDWVVTLTDVDERGHSVRLSSYIVRAKYRRGVHRPQLLTPWAVERYNIFLPNLAHTFAPGHRIRLTITSSCKFIAFPNSNTGLNPYLDPEPVSALQTVYHSKAYPSCVYLPVLLRDIAKER
ncbi:MAG: CocE/NonD family hydrolase [Alicyclobacillus sp.]|nr:CocE/NonD family hydrolase [Alicyclobacillus sp.]